MSTRGDIGVDSGTYPFILGEAPNRKWVIEYRNVRDVECGNNPLHNYQVVFNENKGDISINYKTVGSECEGYIPEAGIQIGENHRVIFDGQLRNEMSLKFKVTEDNVAHINQQPKVIKTFTHLDLVKNRRSGIKLDNYIVDDDMSYINYTVEMVGTNPLPNGVYIEGKNLIIDTKEAFSDLLKIEMQDREGLKVDTRVPVTIRVAEVAGITDIGALNLLAGVSHQIILDAHFENSTNESLTYHIEGIEERYYTIENNVLKLLFNNAGNYQFELFSTNIDHVFSSVSVIIKVEQNSVNTTNEEKGGGGVLSVFFILFISSLRQVRLITIHLLKPLKTY
jgi:hypothetical protein